MEGPTSTRGPLRATTVTVLVLSAALSLPWSAGDRVAAQSSKVGISVHVLTDEGSPLPGIRVNFRNSVTGGTGYRVSGPDGSCNAFYVPPGTPLEITPADPRFDFGQRIQAAFIATTDRDIYFKGTRRLNYLDELVRSTPVYRLRVVLATSTRDDDESDDDVWISFQPAVAENREPPGRYFLDSPDDDFERGSVRTFDVPPSVWGISWIGDIRDFIIGLSGTDGWCYEGLAVVVNRGIRIPIAEGRRRCLDNPGGNLRASQANARHGYSVDTRHAALSHGLLEPKDRPGTVSETNLRRWHEIHAGRVPLEVGRQQIEDRFLGALGQRTARFGNLRPSRVVSLTSTACCILIEAEVYHQTTEQGAFLVNTVDVWRLRTVVATYRPARREGDRQTFLKLESVSGPSPAKGIFDDGELAALPLFQHAYETAKVVNGAVHFDLPGGRPLGALPALPPG